MIEFPTLRSVSTGFGPIPLGRSDVDPTDARKVSAKAPREGISQELFRAGGPPITRANR